MISHFTGSQQITMHLKLVGVDRPENAAKVEAKLEDSAREMVREMEAKLYEEIRRREAAERELDEHQDEEAKLIRRVAAKTRLMHGPKHREMLLEFLKWFMVETNT